MSRPILTAALLLVPCLAARFPAQDPPADASARLEALNAEVKAAIAKWVEQADAAEQRGEQPIPPQPPYGDFVTKFRQAARDFEGTEDAIPFLMKVVQFGDQGNKRDLAKEAIITLVGNHIDSDGLAELAEQLPYRKRVLGSDYESIVTQLQMDGTDNVRGWVTLSQHAAALENEKLALDSDGYRGAKNAVLAVLETADDPKLKNRINGIIAYRETLLPGKAAPEIAGEDIDGVEFKLSDYRGKVVMLDFWGDW